MADKAIVEAKNDTEWANRHRYSPPPQAEDGVQSTTDVSMEDTRSFRRLSRKKDIWEIGQDRRDMVQTWMKRMPPRDAPNRNLWRQELSPHLVSILHDCFVLYS